MTHLLTRIAAHLTLAHECSRGHGELRELLLCHYGDTDTERRAEENSLLMTT